MLSLICLFFSIQSLESTSLLLFVLQSLTILIIVIKPDLFLDAVQLLRMKHAILALYCSQFVALTKE